MAVGANRWPPVWLQRHTRASVEAGVELEPAGGCPSDRSTGRGGRAPHTSTSDGAGPTARGPVEVVAVEVVEEPVEQVGDLVARDAVVDADEPVRADPAVVHDPDRGRHRLVAGLRARRP